MSLLFHPKLPDEELERSCEIVRIALRFFLGCMFRTLVSRVQVKSITLSDLNSSFSVDLEIMRKTLSCQFYNGIVRNSNRA